MTSTRDYSKLCPADVACNPEIIHYFETFYQISDTGDAHDQYASMFTDDAIFHLGPKTSRGSNEILQTRKGMWAAVTSRSHTILGIYPFGHESDKVMIYGTVAHGMQDGSQEEKDWAARAELVKHSATGKWQMKFYQVYLNSAPTLSKK